MGRNAHHDNAAAALQPCKPEGPPRKPCNKFRGSNNTSIETHPAPKESGMPARMAAITATSRVSARTNCEENRRRFPESKTAKDMVRNNNDSPEMPPMSHR